MTVDPTQLGTATLEERSDLEEGEPGIWSYWMSQEGIAEEEEKKWIKRADEIIKRYLDERPANYKEGHKFNILWSNVQTLTPILYSNTPKPVVQRRFLDEDPVGRLASTILERALSYSLEHNGFDDVMKYSVQDKLLPGRGVARVLYVPKFGEPIPADEPQDNTQYAEEQEEGSDVTSAGDEGGYGDEPEAPLQAVEDEETLAEYVYWKDYREGPARTWAEVSWIRYRAYLTRDQLIKRFGKEKGKEVNLDFTPKGSTSYVKEAPPPDIFKKAVVHEYWDKTRREVCWIAPGTPDLVLDRQPDPLNLPDFYPSPNPLLSTTSTGKRVPVPDYYEYQDQANELDTLTARIDRLTKALKVSGIYAGAAKQYLQQLVDSETENRLIAVDDWQAYMDKGGIEKMIAWMPIQQVAATLIHLYEARDRVKQILYEITGLSDIMRGATDPSETLGAQKLKAGFGNQRISPQQKDVAKYARDIIRIMAAVIAGQFGADTLSRITGLPEQQPVPQLPPPPPQYIPGPPPQQQQMMQAQGAPPPTDQIVPQQQFSGNVVPMNPQAQAPLMNLQPNPDYEQWAQQQQAVQAIQAENQAKQQEFMAAVQLIKEDYPHGFKLDIEADSTIAQDEAQEQASRTEFVDKFTTLMSQVIPIAQGKPPVAKMASEITLFAVRAFKVARSLEETIEKAFEALGQMPPEPAEGGAAPTGPTPQEMQIDQKRAQNEGQDIQVNAVLKGQELALQSRKDERDFALGARKQEADEAFRSADIALDKREQDLREKEDKRAHKREMQTATRQLK